MNFDPYLTSNTKINPQWITDLAGKGKTAKLLEEKLREYLHDLGAGRDCLNITQKALTRKEKVDKLDLIKIKSFFKKIKTFCSSKDIVKKV